MVTMEDQHRGLGWGDPAGGLIRLQFQSFCAAWQGQQAGRS